jgi:hypothetical protein
MEIKSTDKKTFQLTENGQQLGELIYENLFFLKAEIKLANAEVYQIKPVGFFGSSIAVTKNGTEIAKLVMTWRGQIVFTFQDGEEFVLKLVGIFANKYILENKDEEKVIQFEPQFNWRNFQYNYNISYNITYDKIPHGVLLVLLGVYATNYFIASMSGANAGLA